MATKQSTVDYILDQLASAGEVSARKMFGGYVLYCNAKVVGLICNDVLYIKITQPGKKFMGEHYQAGRAYPGAKISMMIDGAQTEDREWLSELVRLTADNLPLPNLKKVSKKQVIFNK